jgi:nucleoside diphosphate kinase
LSGVVPRVEDLDVAWDEWSVVLCKPDCVRRDLVDAVLERIARAGEIVARQRVSVGLWQINAHYADLLVNRDTFDLDVPAALALAYAGKPVTVALVYGAAGTPARLRAMLGHFDPSQADPASIRGELGHDSLTTARANSRLVENLVHTSDDAEAVRRDFGLWFGAARHRLLTDHPLTAKSVS